MIRVRQIKVEIAKDNDLEIKRKIGKKLRINNEDIISYEINKKAIDARDKEKIYYVYEVDVILKNEEEVLEHNQGIDVLKTPDENYYLPNPGNEKLNTRPIVVGAGPAGLFASFILAEAGYKPLIIERGKMIDERVKDVDIFWQTGFLNEESNVQFGEGGAGTFSDGKLNTLIKDKRKLGVKVFDTFISCGAPKEIKYEHNPHIGTDKLRIVVKNMREKIIKMGGEFRYSTKLSDLKLDNGKIRSIIVNDDEEIKCDVLVLALGHSARDTFELLLEKGMDIQNKAFAMGIRIMHRQDMINENQYGKWANMLPNASYKLTYTTSKKRGVYSFCMCPGGYVVNASSTHNQLVINGMSNYKRDTIEANSAIIVNISQDDYGTGILDGVKFQQKMESLAFNLGNGKIPIQTLKDFKNNEESKKIGSVKPIVKGDYKLTNIRTILPEFMVESLLEAIDAFDKKIHGFASNDALIAAIESRTSSPIRMVRNEEGMSNIQGIYPTGEGAGYAGGITSSAIDGIKIAEEIIKKYHF